jgi:sigma-B regulation protein RsbU (phosphoserine phosphatase)
MFGRTSTCLTSRARPGCVTKSWYFPGVTAHATLVCGRVSPDGNVEICNAGHCPPLVRERDRVTGVEPTGLPVGTFYSSRYGSRTLHLNAGDALVLYTDGLTEARDAGGEEYGAERLARILENTASSTAEEVLVATLESLAGHLGDRPRTDDLSLLVLMRTAEPQV